MLFEAADKCAAGQAKGAGGLGLVAASGRKGADQAFTFFAVAQGTFAMNPYRNQFIVLFELHVRVL